MNGHFDLYKGPLDGMYDLFDGVLPDGFYFIRDNHLDDRDDHHGNRGHHLPPTQIDATLDPTATDGNGHTLNGTGNPDTGFILQDAGHIEVGQNIHYRTGDTIQPSAVEHNGTLDFNGPAGPQVVDPAHDVSSANANRGAVSFDWSFDTAAHGGSETQQQFLSSGGTEQIKLDLDPGAGDNFLILDAKYDPLHNPNGSHVVWVADNNAFATEGIHQGQMVVADDGGNAFTTQNSTNLAFFQSLIDVDPHHPGTQVGGISPAGQYDFETIVTDHHQTVADVHSHIILA